jgi:GNAT superfamily N-acetyltransferase
MSPRPLDLTLPALRGLRLRIVERPALALGPEALARLLADLRAIASSVLPEGALGYGVLSGDRPALETTIITVVHEARTGRPVAFNAMALLDAELAGRPVEILHLGLVMIDPAFRGRGLSERLYGFACGLLFLRRLGRPLRLSSVTQVPAVVGMVAEIFDDVFPTPERSTRPTLAHRALARQIMARRRAVFGVGDDAGFDPDRSIIRNAYTGGSDDLKKTFDAAPKHRKAVYNAFCADSLDYARGDDFLQIGQINLWTAVRWLGRLALSAPRRAVPPIFRWLESGPREAVWRPWKGVRP